MTLMNRLGNAKNPYQGEYKRVLCVCSAGLLRSPTTALVLSQEPFNYNTRAAGVEQDFALIPVDEVLIEWADEIVCMTQEHEIKLRSMTNKPVIRLDVPDIYPYRDPKLMELIREAYQKAKTQRAMDELIADGEEMGDYESKPKKKRKGKK